MFHVWQRVSSVLLAKAWDDKRFSSSYSTHEKPFFESLILKKGHKCFRQRPDDVRTAHRPTSSLILCSHWLSFLSVWWTARNAGKSWTPWLLEWGGALSDWSVSTRNTADSGSGTKPWEETRSERSVYRSIMWKVQTNGVTSWIVTSVHRT